MEIQAADSVRLKGIHESGGGEAHEMDAVGDHISEMRGSDIQAELDGTSAAVGTERVRDTGGKK